MNALVSVAGGWPLSDVAQGGETVFHQIKLKVSPIKGSAVFWHNYYSCGALYETSEHGSCPIVFGEKYLFAKDISENEQQDFHCDLTPQIPYEVLMNGKSKYV
ncbi:unnamed protein product [Allacma fusca]|uniref:Uncharacterized protein n=1 Tax=Allacma fusca TaxID=39272 RepID=A0A8J2JSP8_9HEXA|nr:unnamed protein product [Allacma fusca]